MQKNDNLFSPKEDCVLNTSCPLHKEPSTQQSMGLARATKASYL